MFSTARLLSKAGKTHGTRLSSKKLMEDSLVKSKRDTQKRKSLKKKAVVEIEVPTEEVVPVGESNKTKSDYDSDSCVNVDVDFDDEVDENVVRSVASRMAKAKGGVAVSPKKEKAKGVLIENPSIYWWKKKEERSGNKL